MNTIDGKTQDLRSLNGALRDTMNGHPVQVENVDHLHGLGAGLKYGQISVKGKGGDYLGALNAGAEITVESDVGKYLGDNMTAGTLIVNGNAGYGAAQYCYGGTVVIRGDAGDFTATMNKGATIVVCGDVGDEAGTYMLKGDLVVLGNAGKNFANYLIRGSVFIGGECESQGHNTKPEPVSEEDIARLHAVFEAHNISADPASLKKLVAASQKPFYH
jgi:methylamine---glutamate N-methyltransferase subunit B